MKICQVISSNLPIGSTGNRQWGAVELITDEYAKHLRAIGHEVDVKYLSEIQADEYDIVHIHVANLCLQALEMGIPYIYSLHDHHSFHYGKWSDNYNQQLKAIKGSVFSICHAEYVVDFFSETDKLFYLTHGVDTEYYDLSTEIVPKDKFKLLMCANNGVAGDYGADRKGFKLGIGAAYKLGMPITVVGAEANEKFFKLHGYLFNYEKLTVISNNPMEDEKLRIFKEHQIFLHPSSLEFGHPNLTLLEAASCCIPMVATYGGSNPIAGLYRLPDLTVDAVVAGIESVLTNYDAHVKAMAKVREKYNWFYVVVQLADMYYYSLQTQHLPSSEVRQKYIDVYNNTMKIW